MKGQTGFKHASHFPQSERLHCRGKQLGWQALIKALLSLLP